MQTRSWTYRFGLAIRRRGSSRRRHGDHGSPGRRRSDLRPTGELGHEPCRSCVQGRRAGQRLQVASRPAQARPLASAYRRRREWKSLHMAAYGTFAHAGQGTARLTICHTNALWIAAIGAGRGERTSASATTSAAVRRRPAGSPRPAIGPTLRTLSFTSTGVGVAASGSGRLYWTQTFGDDVAPRTARK